MIYKRSIILPPATRALMQAGMGPKLSGWKAGGNQVLAGCQKATKMASTRTQGTHSGCCPHGQRSGSAPRQRDRQPRSRTAPRDTRPREAVPPEGRPEPVQPPDGSPGFQGRQGPGREGRTRPRESRAKPRTWLGGAFRQSGAPETKGAGEAVLG